LCVSILANERLKLLAQGYRVGAENQLVLVLSVVCLHGQPRVHVLVDEHVVEYHEIRQRAVPGVVLEDRRWRSIAAFEDNLKRMLRSEASPLRDRHWVARSNGAQHCRKGRLASAILRIDEDKPGKRDGRTQR
jgi:hypothetical protein